MNKEMLDIIEMARLKRRFNLELETIKVMMTHKKREMENSEWLDFVKRTRVSIVNHPDQFLTQTLPVQEVVDTLVCKIFDEFLSNELPDEEPVREDNELNRECDAMRGVLQGIAEMPKAELEGSIRLFQRRQLKRGEYLVRTNDVCSEIVFICKGIFRTYYINEKGAEITLCFCSENRFTTSFKSLVSRQPSELNIEAIEPATILSMQYDELQRLYKESKSWQTIGRLLTEREYLNMERYAVGLNRETAREKYLRLLREQPLVVQRAPVQQIASYLGVTRETLSRIRKGVSETIL